MEKDMLNNSSIKIGEGKARRELPFLIKRPPFEVPNTYNRKSHWTEKQNLKYVCFLRYFREIFVSNDKNLFSPIFKVMAEFMKTRTLSQCRTHHQKKMVKTPEMEDRCVVDYIIENMAWKHKPREFEHYYENYEIELSNMNMEEIWRKVRKQQNYSQKRQSKSSINNSDSEFEQSQGQEGSEQILERSAENQSFGSRDSLEPKIQERSDIYSNKNSNVFQESNKEPSSFQNQQHQNSNDAFVDPKKKTELRPTRDPESDSEEELINEKKPSYVQFYIQQPEKDRSEQIDIKGINMASKISPNQTKASVLIQTEGQLTLEQQKDKQQRRLRILESELDHIISRLFNIQLSHCGTQQERFELEKKIQHFQNYRLQVKNFLYYLSLYKNWQATTMVDIEQQVGLESANLSRYLQRLSQPI